MYVQSLSYDSVVINDTGVRNGSYERLLSHVISHKKSKSGVLLGIYAPIMMPDNVDLSSPLFFCQNHMEPWQNKSRKIASHAGVSKKLMR